VGDVQLFFINSAVETVVGFYRSLTSSWVGVDGASVAGSETIEKHGFDSRACRLLPTT